MSDVSLSAQHHTSTRYLVRTHPGHTKEPLALHFLAQAHSERTTRRLTINKGTSFATPQLLSSLGVLLSRRVGIFRFAVTSDENSITVPLHANVQQKIRSRALPISGSVRVPRSVVYSFHQGVVFTSVAGVSKKCSISGINCISRSTRQGGGRYGGTCDA